MLTHLVELNISRFYGGGLWQMKLIFQKEFGPH